LQIEIGTWTVLLALGAAIATPLIVPFLHQPLVEDYLPIFWMILLATMLRVAADAYGFILLALHRDRTIAGIAAGGAVASAGLNLIPAGGLVGRLSSLHADLGWIVRGAVLAEPS